MRTAVRKSATITLPGSREGGGIFTVELYGRFATPTSGRA
jgi:hypothetical protein